MAVSINPATYIIYVPKADLNLIQPSPEIRELDVNAFRLELKSIEDDPDYGVYLLKTHKHDTETILSGTTYARKVQILDPYTVEFEDGQYQVNCFGANHNLGDVKVVNQVSLIINNSAGLITVVSGSGVTNQDKLDIADQVWNEILADHLGVGSTGEALDNVSSGSSPSQIADAVWDETLADHTTDGTFGNELATKADILASTSTHQSMAISGAVIYGTQSSGTYSSASVRDNTYWEIDESAVNGITVEMIFNLPDTDYRPGNVSVFGHYTGFPTALHHIDLWARNYESDTWELLNEVFLPGGISTDSLYSHEYYERHIDRANNNEVKIRLAHHVTTYNATHNLFIDYMDVSSVKVVTSADIADAVWSEPASGFAYGSFGDILLTSSIDLKRLLGLMHENIYIDNPVYDSDNNLTSARVRIYSSAGSVGTANDIIGTYTISAPSTDPGKFTTWQQIKV